MSEERKRVADRRKNTFSTLSKKRSIFRALWRYCPVCGVELVGGNDKLYGKCQKCGHVWWRNPKPTVAVVIYNKSNPWEVVLTKRKIEPQKGVLDLTGGFVDMGEVFEEAIAREVKEELGLEVKPEEFEFRGHELGDDYVYGVEKYQCLDAWYVLGIDKKIKLKGDEEIAEILWWDLKKRGVPKLAFVNNQQELEQYVAGIK